MDKSFAQILKTELQKKRLSDRDLSKQSFIPLAIVQDILRYELDPDFRTYVKVCNVLPDVRKLHPFQEPNSTPKVKLESSEKKPLSASIGDIVRKQDVTLSILKPEIVESQIAESTQNLDPNSLLTETASEIPEDSTETFKSTTPDELKRFQSCRDAVLHLANIGECRRSDIFADTSGKRWQLPFLNRLVASGYATKSGMKSLMRFKGLPEKLRVLSDDVVSLHILVFSNDPGQVSSPEDIDSPEVSPEQSDAETVEIPVNFSPDEAIVKLLEILERHQKKISDLELRIQTLSTQIEKFIQ